MLVAHAQFAAEAFGEDGLRGGSAGGGPVRHGRAGAKGKGKAKEGKLGPPVDRAWMERWRVELKIAGVRISFGAGC